MWQRLLRSGGNFSFDEKIKFSISPFVIDASLYESRYVERRHIRMRRHIFFNIICVAVLVNENLIDLLLLIVIAFLLFIFVVVIITGFVVMLFNKFLQSSRLGLRLCLKAMELSLVLFKKVHHVFILINNLCLVLPRFDVSSIKCHNLLSFCQRSSYFVGCLAFPGNDCCWLPLWCKFLVCLHDWLNSDPNFLLISVRRDRWTRILI